MNEQIQEIREAGKDYKRNSRKWPRQVYKNTYPD